MEQLEVLLEPQLLEEHLATYLEQFEEVEKLDKNTIQEEFPTG
jgi:hypothetical protein